MDINIALLPDQSTQATLCEISRDLAKRFGNRLVLDETSGPYPHLTLYLTGFLDHSVATLPALIQGSLEGLAPPVLKIRRGVVTGQGSVLLVVEKTKALDHLHRWMIHKLNPFRMKAVPAFWESRRSRFGEADQERLDRIGFPHSLDAWSPHFTIGRVERDRKIEVAAHLRNLKLRGTAEKIGIGKVGEHGSFTELLGEALLS